VNGWSGNIPEEWQADIATGRTLPQFSEFGGYIVLYVEMPSGDELCAACATKAMRSEAPFRGRMEHGGYPEGPTLHCAECNRELPSDYGDPDAPDESD
jgi:hypothetical protein